MFQGRAVQQFIWPDEEIRRRKYDIKGMTRDLAVTLLCFSRDVVIRFRSC